MGATIGHSRDASQAERDARARMSEPLRANSVAVRTVFTTGDLPPSKQFDAYREYCAPVIEISPNEGSGSGFDAVCEMWQLGRFGFRRIRTPAGSFGRSDAQVRRDGLDHWVFNVLRHGEQEARTTTGELRTGAGELSVFSLAGAYQARRTQVDWMGLFVPRGAFPAIDASLNHNHHQALDNSLGRLLAAYLIALADELPTMKEDDLPRAIQAMQLLVEGHAAPSSAVLDSGNTCLDVPRMRLLRDIIDRILARGIFTRDGSANWRMYRARTSTGCSSPMGAWSATSSGNGFSERMTCSLIRPVPGRSVRLPTITAFPICRPSAVPFVMSLDIRRRI